MRHGLPATLGLPEARPAATEAYCGRFVPRLAKIMKCFTKIIDVCIFIERLAKTKHRETGLPTVALRSSNVQESIATNGSEFLVGGVVAPVFGRRLGRPVEVAIG